MDRASAASARPGPAGDLAAALSDEEERVALLTLSLVPGLGPTRLRAVRRAFGSARSAVEAAVRRRGWPELPRLDRAGSAALAEAVDPRAAERELIRATRIGASLVTDSDAAFPASWSAFDDLPPLLYVRGGWPAHLGTYPPRAVAVVGSRRASSEGRAFAFDAAAACAAAGATVVSGLALGIDTAAHRGALAADGSTLAVLAGGVDRPTPVANAPLARQLLDRGGALISEGPIGGGVDRHAFPRRNRLVAALARAVLVVEAGPASGANLTAGHAAGYGRDVLVCPARPWDAHMVGNLALLRDGATPACSVGDLLAALDLERVEGGGDVAATAPALPAGTEQLAWALALLDSAPRAADAVAEGSGRPPGAVLAALERLVAAGVVIADGARRYRLASARALEARRP